MLRFVIFGGLFGGSLDQGLGSFWALSTFFMSLLIVDIYRLAQTSSDCEPGDEEPG